MRRSFQNRKGFTLIEILAIIAITGILASIMIVSLSPAKSNAKLRAAQREVAATIRTAQSYALQGKSQDVGRVCGYGVYFPDDKERYEIFYNPLIAEAVPCEDQNISPANRQHSGNSETSGAPFDLPEGVQLSTSENTIFFDIPHANAYRSNGGALGTAGTITFGFAFGEDEGTPMTVTVNSRGQVTEN